MKKPLQWFNVFNYKDYPAISYGFAVDENGICVMANDKVLWMVGKSIDFIKQFFENKPVELTEIKVYEGQNSGSCKGGFAETK